MRSSDHACWAITTDHLNATFLGGQSVVDAPDSDTLVCIYRDVARPEPIASSFFGTQGDVGTTRRFECKAFAPLQRRRASDHSEHDSSLIEWIRSASHRPKRSDTDDRKFLLHVTIRAPSLSDLISEGSSFCVNTDGAPENWLFATKSQQVAHPTVGAVDRNADLSAEVISYRVLEDGWDGAGSKAPNTAAIDDALAFIDLIPFGASLPDPTVSADGDVGFYWKTADSYVDIVFRGNGKISFFAKTHGVPIVRGEKPYARRALPKELIDTIVRM